MGSFLTRAIGILQTALVKQDVKSSAFPSKAVNEILQNRESFKEYKNESKRIFESVQNTHSIFQVEELCCIIQSFMLSMHCHLIRSERFTGYTGGISVAFDHGQSSSFYLLHGDTPEFERSYFDIFDSNKITLRSSIGISCAIGWPKVFRCGEHMVSIAPNGPEILAVSQKGYAAELRRGFVIPEISKPIFAGFDEKMNRFYIVGGTGSIAAVDNNTKNTCAKGQIPGITRNLQSACFCAKAEALVVTDGEQVFVYHLTSTEGRIFGSYQVSFVEPDIQCMCIDETMALLAMVTSDSKNVFFRELWSGTVVETTLSSGFRPFSQIRPATSIAMSFKAGLFLAVDAESQYLQICRLYLSALP